MKLKGITIEVHEHTKDVNYLILQKKSKTKLVLNADSSVELDGWHKTLASICEVGEETAEQGENVVTPVLKHRYENVELNNSPEHGRDLDKTKGKVPIPTPRNRTPSRDQQNKDITEERAVENKEIRAMKRLEDVVSPKMTSFKHDNLENHVSKCCVHYINTKYLFFIEWF